MGKSSINGVFSMAMLNNQMVSGQSNRSNVDVNVGIGDSMKMQHGKRYNGMEQDKIGFSSVGQDKMRIGSEEIIEDRYTISQMISFTANVRQHKLIHQCNI